MEILSKASSASFTHAALIICLLLALSANNNFARAAATEGCRKDRHSTFHHLSQILCAQEDDASSNGNAVIDSIRRSVEAENDLSKARCLAYECLAILRNNNERSLTLPDSSSSGGSHHCCPASSEDIIQAYQSSTDAFFRFNEDFIENIASLHLQQHQYVNVDTTTTATSNCWDGRESFQTMSVGVGTNSFGALFPESDDGMMSPGSAAIERWNNCCSHFLSCDKGTTSCFDKSNPGAYPLCCELAEGLDNHLILPALREPMVSIRLKLFDNASQRKPAFETIAMEQEGSLRMFDVSGVLWPAGYLLGLCLSNPIACGVPEVLDAVRRSDLHGGKPLAIELGAGVGFSSIALAKALRYHEKELFNNTHRNNVPMVMATDISKPALALITSNAHINGVGDLVAAVEANHTDANSLSLLANKFSTSTEAGNEENDGFSIIIGSSLQALFDGTSRQGAALWQSLDALLSKRNPHAVVVLSHVRTGDDKIQLPSSSERMFECVRRVSGDHFDMKTRDGNASDFEVVLLQRRRAM